MTRRAGLAPALALVAALAAAAARAADAPPPQGETDRPLGHAAGAPPAPKPGEPPPDFLPIEDRWRIGFPRWDRYAGRDDEGPYEEGAWWNPYAQHVLKADYPILGDHTFLDLTLVSDSVVELRSFNVPSGVSTARPRSDRFFGDFDQLFFNQNFITSLELFHGDSAFKPKDWAVRVTPVYNLNYVDLKEIGIVDIDVRDEDTRLDGYVGMQELFGEVHLVDLSPNYDFLTAILGIQPFTSDFRGFLFSDNNLGVRLQGNTLANRIQANLVWFHQLEKDTNSGLNTFDDRDQNVFVANLFVQDFLSEVSSLFEGYTALFSWHLNRDHSGRHFDDNGFIVRPAKIGFASGAFGVRPVKEVDVQYLGWGGDGHIGRLNLTHQYYFAFGREDENEIAGKTVDVRAHFGAVEASVDIDWLRLKSSFLYASGDRKPQNETATGFDTIFDNVFFAGSGFSYFNRQGFPLVTTGVNLVNRLSLVPDLRSSKIEGQANFVNPGLYLYNIGASAKVTQKLTLSLDLSYLQFAATEPLELVLVQDDIERDIGWDLNGGVQYRPLLTENVIVTLGAGALFPAKGFGEIYTLRTLYSTFLAVTLTW